MITPRLAAGLLVLALPTLAHATPVNLIVNGAFEAGATGFATEYAYAPALNTGPEEYTVRAGALEDWNRYFVLGTADHTPGGDLMLVVNGSLGPDRVVWEQAIAVVPGTRYAFSAWGMSVCCNDTYPGPATYAVLRFTVNGADLAALIANQPGVWQSTAGTWDADVTTAIVRLVNDDPGFSNRDFAADDFAFVGEAGEAVAEPESLWLLSVGLVFWVGLAHRRTRNGPR